jgi:catechol 2,3-dioxygenase-like lactoylglutathione lyase family enzyme
MGERGFRPRALGEIAIRTRNLGVMTAFYRDVLGMEVLAERNGGKILFFRIADGFEGHTAVLALFEDSGEVVAGAGEAAGNGGAAGVLGASGAIGSSGAAGSSLHHLALSLPRAEQAAAEAWFQRQNVPCRIETFPWVGWRGLFVRDPDGNTVELVAYDAELLEG